MLKNRKLKLKNFVDDLGKENLARIKNIRNIYGFNHDVFFKMKDSVIFTESELHSETLLKEKLEGFISSLRSNQKELDNLLLYMEEGIAEQEEIVITDLQAKIDMLDNIIMNIAYLSEAIMHTTLHYNRLIDGKRGNK